MLKMRNKHPEMFSFYQRSAADTDASVFGRWNCSSSLCVVDRVCLRTVDVSLFGEAHGGWLAALMPPTCTPTGTHTHSWVSSLTFISCSVRESLFVSRSVVLHLYSTLQIWPADLQDASISFPPSPYFHATISTFVTVCFHSAAHKHDTNLSPSLSCSYWQMHTHIHTLFLNQSLGAIRNLCPAPLRVRLSPAQSRLWAVCVWTGLTPPVVVGSHREERIAEDPLGSMHGLFFQPWGKRTFHHHMRLFLH